MILFRYVLKDFVKYVLGTLALSLFLFVLFDFIHKTSSYFSRYAPTWHKVVMYYLWQTPFQVFQALPLALLIASVMTMVLLGRSHEVTSMRALGMSPFRMALPLAVGGGGFMMLAVVLSEGVIPYTAKRMHYVTEVLIEGESEDTLKAEAFWVKGKDEFVHFERYDFNAQTLYGVKILKVAYGHTQLLQTTHAETAVFHPEANRWTLKGIKRLSLNSQGVVESVMGLDTLEVSLPIDPKKLRVDRRAPDEMSFRELSDIIQKKADLGGDVLSYRIAWHMKVAYPFALLMISLFGLSFGYRSERSTEVVKSLLLACSFGIAYWFFLSTGRALASAGDLAPWFATWLGNMFLSGVVCFQFKKIYGIS